MAGFVNVEKSPEFVAIEPLMRRFLPAELYARVWFDPQSESLMEVFRHLRTLQRVLQDYVPRQVAENPPLSGALRYEWRRGTLLFTDLAGFTPLMEANAAYGQKGALALLQVLNRYFSEMIEIIGKSGGDLLEFTGDAILVQFLEDVQRDDTAQAVRAGLRMQRAMEHFQQIETPQGNYSLAMRVGIHQGEYLAVDLGTPRRMAHVLLGRTVQRAKLAESMGQVGRVCVTDVVRDRLPPLFRVAASHAASEANTYFHIEDNLSAEQLGEYDISLNRRRLTTSLLMDRSQEGMLQEIRDALHRVQPLACYLPSSILNVLVEAASERHVAPDFPMPTVIFVNLLGLPEAVDGASPEEIEGVAGCFSRLFSLIDAAVKARDGVLQKVTYQSVGSDILIYLGAFSHHRDDPMRAAGLAIAIRQLIEQEACPVVKDTPIAVEYRMGIATGAVFAAEIGEPRGRREFNILGDPVNTAARLMSRAKPQEILVSEAVYEAIAPEFQCRALGEVALKGKARPAPVFALEAPLEKPEAVVCQEALPTNL